MKSKKQIHQTQNCSLYISLEKFSREKFNSRIEMVTAYEDTINRYEGCACLNGKYNGNKRYLATKYRLRNKLNDLLNEEANATAAFKARKREIKRLAKLDVATRQTKID